ncbi:MAG: amidohydrolase family protein [Burkholderiaceae bacterium]
MLDTLIKGGTVVDGTGKPAFTADIGIRDGRIEHVGKGSVQARETIAADGATVTPGFVDIHTHYDGQASWDQTFSPSLLHGVTTVVMGNCGVGFAPVHDHDHERLIELMQGVEEIPGAALEEGIQWGWNSFEQYIDALDAKPHSLDFMTLVPHDSLRLFVMGDRAANREAATEADCEAMQGLLAAALRKGAIGFSTGRSDNHRTARGEETPSGEADARELNTLAAALRACRTGYYTRSATTTACVPEDGDERMRFDREYDLLAGMARAGGRPLALTWLERINAPQQHRWLADRADASFAEGLDIRLQTACRPVGIMNGLDTSFNVLKSYPGYREIGHLPVAERLKYLRDPGFKARLLAEKPVKLAQVGSAVPPLVDQVVADLANTAAVMFPLTTGTDLTPNYEPDPSTSFAAQANARGVSALEVIYDYLADGDGGNLIYFPIFNYLRGSMDTLHEMLSHPRALFSLGDAGAHVGTICDASFQTTMLSHWVRDRARGARFSIEQAVEMMSARNARHLGLTDRGLIAPGMRADLNIIDAARVAPLNPHIVRDLPAGGRRVVQGARGMLATLVAGQVICANGEVTGARPGRWLSAAKG